MHLWLRSALGKAKRHADSDSLLTIDDDLGIGVRKKMTTEQFKEMLRYVKTNKRKAAADMLASYAEGTTEQP